MAYRSRRRSSSTRRRSTTRRRSSAARPVGFASARYARSRTSRSGAKHTVRIEIVQPSASAVARPGLAGALQVAAAPVGGGNAQL